MLKNRNNTRWPVYKQVLTYWTTANGCFHAIYRHNFTAD